MKLEYNPWSWSWSNFEYQESLRLGIYSELYITVVKIKSTITAKNDFCYVAIECDDEQHIEASIVTDQLYLTWVGS